jgi:hypothetical protein
MFHCSRNENEALDGSTKIGVFCPQVIRGSRLSQVELNRATCRRWVYLAAGRWGV